MTDCTVDKRRDASKCGEFEGSHISYACLESRYNSSVMKTRFTERQRQYLAFIHYYTKVNGRPPAEADMQRYFRVTPPTVHQMVVTLEAKGFIDRVPGQGRSIRLRVPRGELPELV